MSNYHVEAQVLQSRAVYSEVSGTVYPKEKRLYLAAKRLLDFFGAFIGILLLSPFLLIVSAIIKLGDRKAPVFFKQVRVGKDGKTFHMYKFRSMVTNAEALLSELKGKNEIEGAMFKMKDDPRVTRIGKFIRKTSVDELPQLWNVLKGDMSLVGPRPSLPSEVEEYSRYDRQRLLVTPGCTGLWQVSGRNSLTFHEMVELDLQYIQKRSVVLDIKLILKTIQVMLFPNSAY